MALKMHHLSRRTKFRETQIWKGDAINKIPPSREDWKRRGESKRGLTLKCARQQRSDILQKSITPDQLSDLFNTFELPFHFVYDRVPSRFDVDNQWQFIYMVGKFSKNFRGCLRVCDGIQGGERSGYMEPKVTENRIFWPSWSVIWFLQAKE